MTFPWGEPMRPINGQAWHGIHREQSRKHKKRRAYKNQMAEKTAGGRCDFCGKYRKNILDHMKKAHASVWASVTTSKDMVSAETTPDKQQPPIRVPVKRARKQENIVIVKANAPSSQCPICGRMKTNLNAHIISAHLKEITRPVRSLKMPSGIRSVTAKMDKNGKHKSVRVLFGPHFFVEICHKKSGGLTFVLGATHHGFRTDATEVNGGLEKIINEVRQAHPDLTVD